MVTTKWTGEYPYHCKGEWKLFLFGDDISYVIPKELRNKPMNTKGTYTRWFIDREFPDFPLESYEEYEDGLDFPEWIEENSWVKNLSTTPDNWKVVYEAFQVNDFRRCSCGGCFYGGV